MTTKKTYECNVCRSPIRNNANCTALDGRGFEFAHNRVNWIAVSQAENHICDCCIGRLVNSFQDSGIVEQFGDGSKQTIGIREGQS